MSFLYDPNSFDFNLGTYLDKSNTVDLNVCYIPTAETLCNIGEVCWSSSAQYNPLCNFYGSAEQYITSVVARAFTWYNMTKMCVANKAEAEDLSCDILTGDSSFYDGVHTDSYWSRSVLYDVDSTSIVYDSSPNYVPWDFLKPFSTSLWIILLLIALVVTPLVTSFIEYDENETIVRNFIRYIPDSIHAHLGIDLLSRKTPTNDTSYTLAVFVNLFSMVMIFLYACNLTAYVLYKTLPIDKLRDNYSTDWTIFVYEDLLHYYSNLPNKLIPISADRLPILLKSGSFDAVIGPRTLLQTYKSCTSVINDIRGPGVYKSIDIADKINNTIEYHIKNQMRKTMIQTTKIPQSCSNDPASISLESMYGMFILYFVPVVFFTILAITIYAIRYYKTTRDNSRRHPTFEDSPADCQMSNNNVNIRIEESLCSQGDSV